MITESLQLCVYVRVDKLASSDGYSSPNLSPPNDVSVSLTVPIVIGKENIIYPYISHILVKFVS